MPVHFFMTLYLGVPMSLVLLHPSPIGGGRTGGACTTNPPVQVAGREVSPGDRLALCAGVPTLPFGVPERTGAGQKAQGPPPDHMACPQGEGAAAKDYRRGDLSGKGGSIVGRMYSILRVARGDVVSWASSGKVSAPNEGPIFPLEKRCRSLCLRRFPAKSLPGMVVHMSRG